MNEVKVILPGISLEDMQAIDHIRESLKRFPSPFQIGDAVYCLPHCQYGVVIGMEASDEHSDLWSFLVHPTRSVVSDDEPDAICWFDAEMLRSADRPIEKIAQFDDEIEEEGEEGNE